MLQRIRDQEEMLLFGFFPKSRALHAFPWQASEFLARWDETLRKTPKSNELQWKEFASRRLLASIVESSLDAIFSRSLDGVVTSWNAAAEKIFGFAAEEVIGKSGAILLPPDRMHEQKWIIGSVKKGGKILDFETIRLRKDGRSVPVSLTVSPIRDGRKRIIGASTIARDISMQRQLETELLEIAEQERQRIGRDLHDGLGQQLSGMELLCRSLASALAKRRFPESATAHHLVRQLANTVEQARALARGLVPVIDSPNGLMLALENLASSSELLFNIQCYFVCDEPILMEDHVKAVHLYRIVQESINNAVRHGRAKKVVVTLKRRAQGISLSISDNGTGIRDKPEKGKGIGLHLMRYRAAIIGATWSILPGKQKGTKVSCVLPYDQAAG